MLYSSVVRCFISCDINILINSYIENYLSSILEELDLKHLDYELFHTIIKGVYNNISTIDRIISKKLSKIGHLRD